MSASDPITDVSRRLALPRRINPDLQGGPIVSGELAIGDEFEMVVEPGQKSPGEFAGLDKPPSGVAARNGFAIRSDWKKVLSGTRRVRVLRPMRAQFSIAGPQTNLDGTVLPGGYPQVRFLDYDKDNPFIEFTGPEQKF